MASVITQTYKDEGAEAAATLICETYNRLGNLGLAAQELGVKQSTLSYWMLKLRLKFITVLVPETKVILNQSMEDRYSLQALVNLG